MNLFYKMFPGYKDKNKTEDEINAEYVKNTAKEYLQNRKIFKGNNEHLLLRIQRESLKDDSVFEEFLAIIKDFVKEGIKPSDIVFSIDNDAYKKTFSKKELANLKKLEQMGKIIGVHVGVFDYKDVFSYKEVVNSDRIIKFNANKIKSRDYSPLEKLLNIYLIVSGLKYKFEDKNKEPDSQSRSVYGTLNSDKIVCAGYSELLKAIVKELDDPNLKVFANLIGTKRMQKDGYKIGIHQNNIAYIKDDKYKIDGFYYLDPTWDSIKGNSLNFFLTEIGQIKNIPDNIIDYKEANKLDGNKLRYPTRKSKFAHNYNYKYNASVSKDKVNFNEESFYLNIDDKLSDEFLFKYLLSRQDFKDFVVLEQTKDDLKYIKESFDDVFEQNVDMAKENIFQFPTLANQKVMFQYLKEHSPHFDIGSIHSALITVSKNILPEQTKDEMSKNVYCILKDNIKDAKKYSYYGKETLWTECEDLKEIKEETK